MWCSKCASYVKVESPKCYIQSVRQTNQEPLSEQSKPNEFFDDNGAVNGDNGSERDQNLIFFYFVCNQDDGHLNLRLISVSSTARALMKLCFQVPTQEMNLAIGSFMSKHQDHFHRLYFPSVRHIFSFSICTETRSCSK